MNSTEQTSKEASSSLSHETQQSNEEPKSPLKNKSKEDANETESEGSTSFLCKRRKLIDEEEGKDPVASNNELKSEEITEVTHSNVESAISAADVTSNKPLEPEQDLLDDFEVINDESTKQKILRSTIEQLKRKLCIRKLQELNSLHTKCINHLHEQFYLENNLNYLNYDKFKHNVKENKKCIEFVTSTFASFSDLSKIERSVSHKLNISNETLMSIVHNESSNTRTALNESVSSAALSKSTNDQSNDKQAIVERAKHEAQILQRITQLRKEGLWSIKRLPKLIEPARLKTHWDYLLDEVTWMSTDFQQERKWKKNTSKKIATAIQKYFKEKELKAEMAEKEETKRLRKQANLVAREVMLFWKNVEKIVQYKQSAMIEEKRKQALDLHLNFIVDQTEKYSNWLMESLNTQQPDGNQEKTTTTINTSDVATSQKDGHGTNENDPDYFENKDMDQSEDDESTIEKEEQLTVDYDVNDEIDKLKMESELSLEELLKKYNVNDSYFDQEETNQDDNENENDEEDNDEKPDGHKHGVVDTLDSTQQAMDASDSFENEDESKFDDYDVDNEAEEDEANASSTNQADDLLKELISNETTSDTVSITNENKTEQDDKMLSSIAAQAQSLQPTGYTLETTHVKTPVPKMLLKHDLREYQHVGLDWLVTMYENKLNGILADEMGLGKTIQTIALLAHLACEKGVWGPHLIVVPTSVMLNWELEFKKWCPGFKILTYYGNPKERRLKRQGWTKHNAFHVCITSYKLVIQDHAAFRRKKWKYFILDEAQNIKNFKSQRWQMLLNFQSTRRLLLTGTPLQNNLMELWSLMHFLMPHVFSSHREFNLWFSNPLKCMIEGSQEYNEQLIRRLHKVLRPFLLRRLKIDVEKQMPKKYEHVVNCKLSKRQRLLYDEFMSLSSTKETLKEGRYMSVINILMQLRKVCNHPDLFEPRPILSPFVQQPLQYNIPSLVFNLNECLHTKFSEDVIFYHPTLVDMEISFSAFTCHRAKKLQNSLKMIEEIMTSYPALPPTQISFNPHNDNKLSRGDTGVESNEDDTMNEQFDEDKFFFNDSFQGISLKRNSMARNHIKQQIASKSASNEQSLVKLRNRINYLASTNKLRCAFYKPMYGQDLRDCVGPSEVLLKPIKTIRSSGQYNALSYSTCQQTLDYEQTKHTMGTYWSQTQTLSDMLNIVSDSIHNPKHNHKNLAILDRFIVYVSPVRLANKNVCDLYENSSIKLRISHPNPSFYQRQTTLIEDITNKIKTNVSQDAKFSSSVKILNRIENSMCTQFPEKRLIQYDCGKLQVLSDLLRKLFMESHRVLIFTQMTRMLDILENFLNYHGYKYLRLDGSTSIEQRQALMERFNNDKRIFVFILSTRSGGIGVNLTGADTVVFYDSDWNPTMDAQAQDRCHRIGQTRDVHIYRLISEKTVEENILKKANQKRLLSDMTIEGGCFTTALLKKHHISELFDENANDATNNMQVDTESNSVEPFNIEKLTSEAEPDNVAIEPVNVENEFEQVLALVEDESDVQATKNLKAEVNAEIAEFDENEVINTNEESNSLTRSDEPNKLQLEFRSIEIELKPVEKYALRFLESYGEINLNESEQNMQIDKVKQEWELTRLKQLKEEEERKAEEEEDELLFTYAKTEVSKKSKTNLKKSKKKAKKKDKKQKNKKSLVFKNKKSLRIDKSFIRTHLNLNNTNKNDDSDELNNEAVERETLNRSNDQNDDNDNENSMILAKQKFLSSGLINSELDKYKKLAKYEREIKEKQNRMQLKNESSKVQENATLSHVVEQHKTSEEGKSTKRSNKRLTSSIDSASHSSSLLSSSFLTSLAPKENLSSKLKTKSVEQKSAIKKAKMLNQLNELKYENGQSEKTNSLKLKNNTLNESSESENDAELNSTSNLNEKPCEQTDKQQKPKEKLKKPRKSKLNDSTNVNSEANIENAAATSSNGAVSVGIKKRGRKPKSLANTNEAKNLSINQLIANKTNQTLGENLLEKFNTQIKSQLIMNNSETNSREDSKMLPTSSYLISKLDVPKPCINPALSSFMKPQSNGALHVQPPVVRVLPNLNLKPINSFTVPMISKNTINPSTSNPTTIYITKKPDQSTTSNSISLPVNLQLNSNLNTQNKVIIKATPSSPQFVKSSNGLNSGGMFLLNQNVSKPSLPVNMATQKILSITKPTFLVAPNQTLLSNQLNIPTTSKIINLATLSNNSNINNNNNEKNVNL